MSWKRAAERVDFRAATTSTLPVMPGLASAARPATSSVSCWRVARGTVLLVGVAFVANVAWELAQRPLYHEPVWPVAVCLRAAVSDAVIITLAAGAGLAVRRRVPTLAPAVFLVGLAATGYLIEVHALHTGRWAYNASMPTLGRVGLTPLVQLALTGSLAVALTHQWHRRANLGS